MKNVVRHVFIIIVVSYKNYQTMNVERERTSEDRYYAYCETCGWSTEETDNLQDLIHRKNEHAEGNPYHRCYVLQYIN